MRTNVRDVTLNISEDTTNIHQNESNKYTDGEPRIHMLYVHLINVIHMLWAIDFGGAKNVDRKPECVYVWIRIRKQVQRSE